MNDEERRHRQREIQRYLRDELEVDAGLAQIIACDWASELVQLENHIDELEKQVSRIDELKELVHSLDELKSVEYAKGWKAGHHRGIEDGMAALQKTLLAGGFTP